RVGRGLAVGGAAGLALGLVEAGYVLVARPLAFDETGERARFALITISLLAGAGVVVGALVALACAGVRRVADRIGRPSSVETRRAALYAIAVSPAIAWCAVAAFAGRRMRLLPARPLLVALAALAGIALAFVAIRVAQRVGARASERASWPRGLAVILVGGAL